MYDTTKKYTREIVERIKSTWKDGMPPASVDGLGTKGVYHWQQRTFREATLDALHGNLNDMGMMRARVRFLLDHISIPQDDEEACYEIIDTLVDECLRRKIVILGGETSIHDNYSGMEISVFVLGYYLSRLRNVFREEDTLIGLRSSCLHCNGFTKIRKVFGEEFRPEFVEPTLNYYDVILDLIQKTNVNSMMNITGGAFTRFEGILGQNDALISSDSLKPHEIFYEMYRRGVSDEEMYKTFNCGIGFVLSVSQNPEITLDFLGSRGLESKVIGKVVKGSGKIKIQSAFSDKEIVY